ncbi:MAG: SusC/RagA family TonB-linked outer membrane protein [Sphingobacteriales bacterium]|nr:MAG: SusC/RagA family TonB-linked outer membrane protein [Sphingobacteriales bacterium]
MRKLLMTFLVTVIFMVTATAQDRQITGRVVDDKNSPLEGVTVTASDGKGGTQTDRNGAYSITISSAVKSLVFSFVNYESVSKQVGRATTINVTLNSNDVSMEEVVVVGYGVQQKKAFTGSASNVDAKEFAQLVTPSVDRQLAGRAAGVNVNVNSGQVNAPARIRIRGTNSFSQGLSPLIIVDGSPITTGNLALISNSNALGDVNPNDIETIDVLKDGSATAIYGSRAANGVIVITTKKGVKGRTNINYAGTHGFSSALKRFELLNANQFVTIANEKFVNAGQLPPARMDSANTNTNWQDNVFVDNAPSTSHTLSIAGGSDKSTYFMSLNYADTRGIVRTNRNTSYRIRANIESQAKSWLKLGNNLAVSRSTDYDQNNGTNALSGAIVGAIRALPNVPIYSRTHPTGYNIAPTANALGAGGNLRTIDDNYTNIAFVLDNNRYQSEQYRILNNSFLELGLAKGLTLRSQIGIDYYTDNSTQILDPRHGDGASSVGSIYQGQQNIFNTNIQNFLNYNLSIANTHNIYATVGHELQQTTSRFFAANGINLSDIFYLKENIITNTAGTPSISGNYTKSALESLFGRLNYDYKSKYFVQATLRRDGQSSLAEGKKYGTFPGFSVGWRPVQEGFWKTVPFLEKNISDFKLRASYAVVGNRLGGFPYLSTYGSRPYGNVGGLAVAVVGNPDLQWEQSKKYDVGFDLGLLNNRVKIMFDYFKNDLDQLVLDVPTPFSTGIPGNSISQNIGRVQNKGVELSIDATVLRRGDFEWNINANYSHIKNKIVSLFTIGGVETTELFPSNYNINRVGEAINSIYGYEFAGVNSGNGNPVYLNAAGRYVQRNISNGTYYFANSLNDPALGATTTLTQADKKILGSAQPTDFGAFTNTFNYKGFGLEVMFRYQAGNKIVNITRQEILSNQKFANAGADLLNRWTTPGQVTNVPKLWYNQDAIINQNGEATTRFIEDGDFLRLQNIVLSYDLNASSLQSVSRGAIRSARFFVQAQNVYVWTNYRGIDPEAYSENGQDNSISPQVRNISFGVNLGL